MDASAGVMRRRPITHSTWFVGFWIVVAASWVAVAKNSQAVPYGDESFWLIVCGAAAGAALAVAQFRNLRSVLAYVVITVGIGVVRSLRTCPTTGADRRRSGGFTRSRRPADTSSFAPTSTRRRTKTVAANPINLNNPPKFYIVVLSLVCITVLMVTRTIDSDAGLGLLGLIVGYAVGNGIAAKDGDPVEPIVGTGHREHPHPDTDD